MVWHCVRLIAVILDLVRVKSGGLQAEPFNEPDAAKSNGNNVNIDKEMMKLAENQIDYNATIQMMSKRHSTLMVAITENAQA